MTAITAERTCEVTRLHYFDNPGDARPRKFYDIYLVTHDDSTASVLINYGAGASPRVTGGRQTYTSGRLQVKHQGRLAAMEKMRDKLMAAKEGRGYQFRNREQVRVCDRRFNQTLDDLSGSPAPAAQTQPAQDILTPEQKADFVFSYLRRHDLARAIAQRHVVAEAVEALRQQASTAEAALQAVDLALASALRL